MNVTQEVITVCQKIITGEVHNPIREGYVSGIHNRVMPGRSASSDAHHSRSEDGKKKFASKHPMTMLQERSLL